MTATATDSIRGPRGLVNTTDLVKTYGSGESEVQALRGVTLDFDVGRFTAIMGPSGSGKSTLLHCLAGLDRPTSGEVRINNQVVSGMSERELTKLRRSSIGFIFQAFNLVPSLTAAENITLPGAVAHQPVDQRWYETLVGRLGLDRRVDHRPTQMSGGQQQRVACARALVMKPTVVFADEPTGNLDTAAALEVLGFLRQAVEDFGQTVIMVTHDPAAAATSHRVIYLADGQVAAELAAPTVDRVVDVLRDVTAKAQFTVDKDAA
jgi:putative ABC transport system ATP-binding protein